MNLDSTDPVAVVEPVAVDDDLHEERVHIPSAVDETKFSWRWLL